MVDIFTLSLLKSFLKSRTYQEASSYAKALVSAPQTLIGERWLNASAPKITERERKLALSFAL